MKGCLILHTFSMVVASTKKNTLRSTKPLPPIAQTSIQSSTKTPESSSLCFHEFFYYFFIANRRPRQPPRHLGIKKSRYNSCIVS